jgi:3-oxoacyl-[acyl-carrier-protein] synthase II
MNRRVVVTGLGIISPIGNSVGEFWSSLAAGKCGIGPITKFDTEKYKAKLAAEVKGFDPLTYMEKNDVAHADLCTQFAVAAATQAVEDSGIVGTMAPERIGTYLGTGIGGIGTFLTEHTKLMEKGPRRISPYFIPMMIANMPASTIAMRYKFKNASMPSVTACSSAANAIGEALRAVRHGYCDAVLTGGGEATIVDIAVAGFTNMQALSTETDPTLASLPFDLRRKGFVMGEGAGCLVIEEYEHAVNRGAHIYAELCGYGVTCDAYHMTAPEPDGNGGARALAQAFQEAGGTDEDRIYINAHGTGTPMNDLTETLAIKTAFGE